MSQSLREQFLSLVKNDIHRQGIDELVRYLENSDFFDAPASTKFHGSYEGGLVQHSIDVYNALHDELAFIYGDNYLQVYSEETIAIVSLFHDLCKVGRYKSGTRNVKDPVTKQWHEEPTYFYNENAFELGHGSEGLLDLLIEYVPTPLQHGAYKGFNDKNELVERISVTDAPMSAFVFKTIVDPFVGRLNMFKVVSGTLNSGMTLKDVNKENDEKISAIYYVKGKKQEPTSSIVAGDIGALAKLGDVTTGDTLTEDPSICFEPIVMPAPVYSMALFAAKKGEEETMTDPYQVLGVSPDASDEEIKKEYRDEKAVKNAITRISSGEYQIVHVEETEETEAVEETAEETATEDAE